MATWPVTSALAASPVLPEQVVTPNFVVHYTTAAGNPDVITPAAAQLAGGNAEKALAAEEAALGFDAPPSGPDAHIDIYIYEFRAPIADGIVGLRAPGADQSESYILLRTSTAGDLAVIAHEIFHVLQNSVWASSGKFLAEATAVWAQQRVFAAEGVTTDFNPVLPLDCVDENACPAAGYQSWSFFEFLAERYGPRIVREIYEQAKALRVNRGGRASIAAVAAAVAAHGGRFGTAFRDFALANVNGDYTLDQLKGGVGGVIDTKPLSTGAKMGKLLRRVVYVDHLATTYLPVFAGGGKRVKCRRTRLRLGISGPRTDAFAGYVLNQDKPKPIALVAGRGSVTLRSWSTCPRAELILALVSAGTSSDKRRFTVTAKQSVR